MVSEDLTYIGGTYGSNLKVTPFLCLLFKLIQLSPKWEIVKEFLHQKYFKYLTALAAMYIRLFARPKDVYLLLEPLLNDYRKLKYRQKNNEGVILIYMDTFVDDLLRKERVCDIALPRLTKRIVLEDDNQLEPRESSIQSELDDSSSNDES